MENSLVSRAKNVWNAFFNRDPTVINHYAETSYSYRPDRVRFSGGNEKTIITSIYNRIAIDAAKIDILHVDLDADGRYVGTRDSGLNNCLNFNQNLIRSIRNN